MSYLNRIKNKLRNLFRVALQHDDAHRKAMQAGPLLIANKTYNTNHPNYHAPDARNFPGKILNEQIESNNPIFLKLKAMLQNHEIGESQWKKILQESLDEVKTIPHANEVFDNYQWMEDYAKNLEKKYQAFYHAGWVNLEDALFLYWAVRQLNPKVIVQTGVCNGLSAAFMVLALAKNGSNGKLHAIDLPHIFNSADPAWKVKGKVYGVVIPEGKKSGWLAPEFYKNHFQVLEGDAKILLPDLVKKLGNVDMFYHDSDHTYDHMTFEFNTVKPYLNKSSVVIADDISWNASLWDFADEALVPAYNYRGSMGIACF